MEGFVGHDFEPVVVFYKVVVEIEASACRCLGTGASGPRGYP